jgi:hypothetical protein
MKTIIILCVFCVGVLQAAGGMLSPYKTGKVTVRVIDENNQAIFDATAGIGFSKNKPLGKEWGTLPFSMRGQTDSNGVFSAEAEGNPSISCSARKEGYYPTLGAKFLFTNSILGRWQPWNPTVTVVLRKIGNPIPMFARRVETMMPVLNEPAGFDLEAGDWVSPYGKGQVADFIFTMKQRYVAWEDFDIKLVVSFQNKFDGMKNFSNELFGGSLLKHERHAPDGGYMSDWTVEVGNNPVAGRKGMTEEKNKYLIFRVRTKLDENGNIKEAKYGRTTGNFNITGYAVKNPTFSFTYYLNPTPNDRNLEFDPKRNLFKNLGTFEEVSEP